MVGMLAAAVSAWGVGLLAAGQATPDSPYAWISTGGLIAFLLYFFIYGVPNKWVPRELHDSALSDQARDAEERVRAAEQREREWREIALTGTNFAKRTVPLIEAAMRGQEGR